MATEVARLRAYLDADTRDFDRAMGRSETKTQQFGRIAKAALVGGAAAGIYALGKAAKIGWDEYNAGQRVAAQTNAVIKSTGGVANVTADQVEELGRQLMLKSGIDDEVIKSGENVLLTFRNIRNEVGQGNDIFNQATKLTTDLSVAMGRDLNSSAVLVGKALNDPIRGVSSLTRVGVQFNDQQRAMIERMVESGRTMEAQKVILRELQKEFGGSAEAAGKTFGGQLNILRERLNNFLGDLVGKAIPYLQRFILWAGPRIQKALDTTREIIDQFRRAFNQTADALRSHEDSWRIIQKAIQAVGVVLRVVIQIQLFWLRTTITVWTRTLNIVLTVTDKIIAGIRLLGNVARTVGRVVAAGFRVMLAPIFAVINAVQRLIDLIHAIPSVNDLNPFRSGNAGVPTGRGGSGARGPAPRLGSAGGGDIHLNLNIDGETLHRVIRRREQQWANRGGL